MSLVRFLLALGFGSVVSWVAWVVIVTSLDPFSGGLVVIILFYCSGGLAMVGTLTLGNFFLRYWLEKDKIPFQQISVAMRQAATLTIGVVVGFVLQAARLLNPWSLVVLCLLIILAEFFFLAGQSRRPRQS